MAPSQRPPSYKSRFKRGAPLGGGHMSIICSSFCVDDAGSTSSSYSPSADRCCRRKQQRALCIPPALLLLLRPVANNPNPLGRRRDGGWLFFKEPLLLRKGPPPSSLGAKQHRVLSALARRLNTHIHINTALTTAPRLLLKSLLSVSHWPLHFPLSPHTPFISSDRPSLCSPGRHPLLLARKREPLSPPPHTPPQLLSLTDLRPSEREPRPH